MKRSLIIGATMFGLLSYLIVAAFLSLIKRTPAQWDLSILLIGLAYCVGVYLILCRPLFRLALPQLQAQFDLGLRILLFVLMISPPLVAFGYFLGGLRDLLDWHELVLTVLPAVLLAAVSYEKWKSVWIVYALLIGGTVPSYFLFQDVLSGFTVFQPFLVANINFYLLKTFMILTVMFAFIALFASLSWDDLFVGAAALCAYVGIMGVVVPLTFAILSDQAWHNYLHAIPYLILDVTILILINRRLRVPGWGFPAWTTALVVSVLATFGFLWLKGNPDYWGLSLFTLSLLQLGLLSLLVPLFRQGVRS